jgi:hypothetical protein
MVRSNILSLLVGCVVIFAAPTAGALNLLGDFNNDGKLDLMKLSNIEKTKGKLKANIAYGSAGTSSFSIPRKKYREFMAMDFDGDGDHDVVSLRGKKLSHVVAWDGVGVELFADKLGKTSVEFLKDQAVSVAKYPK